MADADPQRHSSTSRALVPFVTAIARTSPRLATATILLTLTVGLFEGVGLLALIPLLQLVGLDAQQGSLGRFMELFRAAFATVGLAPTLPAVLACYVAIVAAQSVLQRQQAIVQTLLRNDVVHALRTRLYRAVAGTTWVYFSRHRAALFGQMLTQRVDRVANAAYYLLDLFVTGVIALVYIGIAFRVSAVMTLFVVICGAVLALALRGRLALARRFGQEFTSASNRLYTATSDHLESMKMAKGYGAERRHAERFAQLSEELGLASRHAMDASIAARQWLSIGSALLLAVIVYVAQAVIRMPPASLFLLIFLFARLVPRLTSLYEKAQLLAVELPAFEMVLQAETDCLAAAEAEPRTHEAMAFERAVECRQVTFTYRGEGETPALQDVSLRIAAQTTTAIVGPSGAGKSTLADLLMGLVTPSAGSVRVDDVPLSPERMQAWRRHVGYVSQETFLFHDTRAREPALGPTRGDRQRHLARAGAGGRRRLHPGTAERIGHDRRRSRAPPVWRGASASVPGTCAPAPSPGADPRRGHQLARFRERTSDSGGDRSPARANHDRRDHASAVDDSKRRRDLRRRARACGGVRIVGRASGREVWTVPRAM